MSESPVSSLRSSKDQRGRCIDSLVSPFHESEPSTPWGPFALGFNGFDPGFSPRHAKESGLCLALHIKTVDDRKTWPETLLHGMSLFGLVALSR